MTVHDATDSGRTDRLAAADLPTLLTKEDVAEYFGVSPRTIEAWRQADTGPAPIKIGKHLRWTATSVREFVLSQDQSVE
ncbi:helix-turn-helix transcriptional regulator [Microbacterium sp. 2MCAF23]|uniref:helix-turn-helix transcriptional regulator n=1 Tax=Microbacterium sp. 2MCAF23 TaxID=3232985 RepID=UPI003F9DD17A